MTDANNNFQLVAKQEIAEQLNRWTRAADRLDLNLMEQVFLPEANINYGNGLSIPATEFFRWVLKFHGEELVWTSHSILSLLTRFETNRVTSEAVVMAVLRYNGSEGLTDLTVFGRYLDEWRQSNGRWLIASRIALRDAYKTEKVAQNPEFGPWFHEVTLGERNSNDASYAYI